MARRKNALKEFRNQPKDDQLLRCINNRYEAIGLRLEGAWVGMSLLKFKEVDARDLEVGMKKAMGKLF